MMIERIDPHHRPHARPERAESDCRRSRSRCVPGRHAGVFGFPDERHIGERIVVAADIRPRAADQPLDDGANRPGRPIAKTRSRSERQAAASTPCVIRGQPRR